MSTAADTVADVTIGDTTAGPEEHPPWPHGNPAEEPRENPEYATLLAAQRELLDALAESSLPGEVSDDVAARLRAITSEVAAYRLTGEHGRQDSWRRDLRGRANPVFPPFEVQQIRSGRLTATVTFPRVMVGGNSAAHGGTLPLVFDDLLGLVANRNLAGVARTAYLTVNFRRITPIGRPLEVEATLDKVDGRKRWTSGRITDAAGNLLADAEALFVELRPGQP